MPLTLPGEGILTGRLYETSLKLDPYGVEVYKALAT
ncbi:Beta-galactosidase C-terminal domain [Paenibacillus phyllosphaerae]